MNVIHTIAASGGLAPLGATERSCPKHCVNNDELVKTRDSPAVSDHLLSNGHYLVLRLEEHLGLRHLSAQVSLNLFL